MTAKGLGAHRLRNCECKKFKTVNFNWILKVSFKYSRWIEQHPLAGAYAVQCLPPPRDVGGPLSHRPVSRVGREQQQTYTRQGLIWKPAPVFGVRRRVSSGGTRVWMTGAAAARCFQVSFVIRVPFLLWHYFTACIAGQVISAPFCPENSSCISIKIVTALALELSRWWYCWLWCLEAAVQPHTAGSGSSVQKASVQCRQIPGKVYQAFMLWLVPWKYKSEC